MTDDRFYRMRPKIKIIAFTSLAWEDYLYWLKQDKKTLKRINALIRDIQRDPFGGVGKPEPLKFELAGMWSRRIDQEHRLVYQIEEGTLVIFQCRYHYD